MGRIGPLAIVPFFVLVAAAPLVATAQSVIDDFEGYAGTPALNVNWLWTAVSLDTGTSHGGSQSMRIGGSVGPYSGLRTQRRYSPPLNLSGQTVSVWVRRDPTSLADTAFELWAYSEGGGMCVAGTIFTDTNWHQLPLDLTDPGCVGSGLDDTKISAFDVTIKNPSGSISGTVWGNADDLTTSGPIPVELESFRVE